MKTIYLVHCWGGTSKDGWYPWIKEEISGEHINVETFDMPNTDKPDIKEWIDNLEKKVLNLDENTYFVGHSIGCQTIMRYLENKNVNKIGGILFVAPWIELLPYAINDEESYKIAYPWLNTQINFESISEGGVVNKVSNTTVTPKVNLSFGDVHETADVRKVISDVSKMLNEAVHAAAEGIH